MPSLNFFFIEFHWGFRDISWKIRSRCRYIPNRSGWDVTTTFWIIWIDWNGINRAPVSLTGFFENRNPEVSSVLSNKVLIGAWYLHIWSVKLGSWDSFFPPVHFLLFAGLPTSEGETKIILTVSLSINWSSFFFSFLFLFLFFLVFNFPKRRREPAAKHRVGPTSYFHVGFNQIQWLIRTS